MFKNSHFWVVEMNVNLTNGSHWDRGSINMEIRVNLQRGRRKVRGAAAAAAVVFHLMLTL